MKIYVTKGVGTGPTKTAAFDAALFDAGIANYNLIRLSSVIPPASEIIIGKINWNNKEHGHKLYVVLADNVGEGKVSSGVGWIQGEGGKGLFVEETAENENEEEVKNLVRGSLNSMRKYRQDKYGEINMEFVSFKGKEKYSCSVVAAVYKSEGWQNS